MTYTLKKHLRPPPRPWDVHLPRHRWHRVLCGASVKDSEIGFPGGDPATLCPICRQRYEARHARS